MSPDTAIARRQVEIIEAGGFHLRAATEFIRLALQYRAEVWIRHDGRQYNGRSILDLMTMAAGCGSRLELEARGSDAQAAVDALADLIQSRPVAPDGGRPAT